MGAVTALVSAQMVSFLLVRLRVLVACLVVGAFGAMSLLGGCSAGQDNSSVRLPAPIESTTIGPGDVFTVQVVGEKELPTEYQVASDGTVDFPYVHTTKVAGLEPQAIARLLRQRLIEAKILTDPSVIVAIKEYNSKRITVLGQVAKPGSFPLTPGLTLLQAISLAGGFTAIATRDGVNLTRQTKSGRTTVVLNIDAITDGRSPDIALQAGDSIYVRERVF